MESATSWLPLILRTIVIFFIPAAYLFKHGRRRLRLSKLVDKIPGPRAWPLIGNALLMTGQDLAGMFLIITGAIILE
jgi:hypothetical protein